MKKLLILTITVFLGGCSKNAFTGMSSDDDLSLRFAAKELMNQRQWTDAINKFDEMSTSFRNNRENTLLRAQAYAGRCGMEFIALVDDLANSGTKNIFTVLMQNMTGATSSEFNDCVTAEDIIRTSISSVPADRTVNENLSLAFIALAKIGAVLTLRADANNDGTTQWGHDDSCTVGDGANDFLTNNEAKHIATGVAIALDSLVAAGVNIGDATETDLDSVCATIGCNDKDTSNVDATEEKQFRGLAQEVDDGVGLAVCTAGTPDTANCVCP